MKIKKVQLETLFNVTKGTEGVLTLAESRVRDTFIKPLLEHTQRYLEDKQTIYKEYCLKDEKGEPQLVDGDKYEFPKEKLEEINKELVTLSDEEVELETPENIKEILEKTTYLPKIYEAEIIDELINSL